MTRGLFGYFKEEATRRYAHLASDWLKELAGSAHYGEHRRVCSPGISGPDD